MLRLLEVVVLAALPLTLTGCGGSSGGGASPPKPSASSAASAAKTNAGGNPVDAKAFCAFLTKMEPRLTKDGSSVGAEADLAIELATWVESHAQPRTAADLDEAASKSCPQVRTRVVKLMGGTSFSDTIG